MHRTYSEYDATLSEWEAILTVAKTYRFSKVKALAAREISRLGIGVAECIKLFEENDVDKKFLVPLYKTFVERPESLSDEDITILGDKTALVIMRARERVRSQSVETGRIPVPNGVGSEQVVRVVCSLLSVNPNSGEVVRFCFRVKLSKLTVVAFSLGKRGLRANPPRAPSDLMARRRPWTRSSLTSRLSNSSDPRRNATYNLTFNSDRLFLNVRPTQRVEDTLRIAGNVILPFLIVYILTSDLSFLFDRWI